MVEGVSLTQTYPRLIQEKAGGKYLWQESPAFSGQGFADNYDRDIHAMLKIPRSLCLRIPKQFLDLS